jgi:hypothetical protein
VVLREDHAQTVWQRGRLVLELGWSNRCEHGRVRRDDDAARENESADLKETTP